MAETTGLATTTAANPLEIEDILNYILQYVGGTAKINTDLLKCRLVSHFWNTTIVRMLNQHQVKCQIDSSRIHKYLVTCKDSQIERLVRNDPTTMTSPAVKIHFIANTNTTTNYQDYYKFKEMKSAILALISPAADDKYMKSTCKVTNISCYLESLDSIEFRNLLALTPYLQSIDLHGPFQKSINGVDTKDDFSFRSSLTDYYYNPIEFLAQLTPPPPLSLPNLTCISYHLQGEPHIHEEGQGVQHQNLIEIIKSAPNLEKLIIAETNGGFTTTEYLNPDQIRASNFLNGEFMIKVLNGFTVCKSSRLRWELPITELELPIYDDFMLNTLVGLELPNLKSLTIRQHLIVMLSTEFGKFLAKSCHLYTLNLYFVIRDQALLVPEDLLQAYFPCIKTIRKLGYFIESDNRQPGMHEGLTTSLVVASVAFPALQYMSTNSATWYCLATNWTELKYNHIMEQLSSLPEYLIPIYKKFVFPHVVVLTLHHYNIINHADEENDDVGEFYEVTCANISSQLELMHCLYPALKKLIILFGEHLGSATRIIYPHWLTNNP